MPINNHTSPEASRALHDAGFRAQARYAYDDQRRGLIRLDRDFDYEKDVHLTPALTFEEMAGPVIASFQAEYGSRDGRRRFYHDLSDAVLYAETVITTTEALAYMIIEGMKSDEPEWAALNKGEGE